MHLQLLNGGTAQRTILSVTFGYRDPDRAWKRSWEFLAPIPGPLGDVKPIRLAADSEHVETFRADVALRFRQKVGGIIGSLINATDPNGPVKYKEVELIEITQPADEETGFGMGFRGKPVESILFDT